jgi:hypothetical protein
LVLEEDWKLWSFGGIGLAKWYVCTVEMSITGMLPSDKLPIFLLKPNLTSRHTCLEVRSCMFISWLTDWVLFWDWPSSLASNFQLEVAFQFYPVQWSALSEKFCLYFDMLSKLGSLSWEFKGQRYTMQLLLQLAKFTLHISNYGPNMFQLQFP